MNNEVYEPKLTDVNDPHEVQRSIYDLLNSEPISHENPVEKARDDLWALTKKMNIPAEAIPHILDSGNRREFESGAVRDMQEGKGRCDLMPLDVVALVHGCGEDSYVFECISRFQEDGRFVHLCGAIETFYEMYYRNSIHTMLLEVAKHFEEGCKKYGENNWQKGIPVRCYIDSAVRHYLKYLRGDNDEPHDRAFCWNILCCIWTCKHKPELNDYAKHEKGTITND